ncbi:MAG: HAMP domain-containing protein [Bacteroidales bacterium]|nr:HAMP domain-containing protein [Bacteroidales bacterium]
MKSFSFRVKIIGTILLVVSLCSLFSFTLFNIFLRQRLSSHTEEIYNQMNLLRDHYYFTISQHDGRIIKLMLKSIENDKDVLKTYMVNSKARITYPENYTNLSADTLMLNTLYKQMDDISVKSYHKETIPFYRVFIRLQNSSSCHSCHNPAQRNLGMIIMDISDDKTDGVIALTKEFSLYYTFSILITIFLLVAYLHYKYIRKSLKQFRSTINHINQGNLDARLEIPEARELGSLGKNFNNMLDTLESTQKELEIYHQKELQNSQKLATIGEMSARIAHEIRNPVTGIARAMEVIIAQTDDHSNKPILEEIQRQANRVNQAITNLLRYSRTKEITLEEGNINETITSLVFFLQNQAHEKPISFEMNLMPNLPLVSYDHEQIENVLLNISFNAMQAIDDSGKIIYTSAVAPEQTGIIVSVQDNGSGIPKEIEQEVFKPFYTTRTKGTGLGLAISKDILEKHDGRLWFENNEGNGCTFSIYIPFKKEPYLSSNNPLS